MYEDENTYRPYPNLKLPPEDTLRFLVVQCWGIVEAVGDAQPEDALIPNDPPVDYELLWGQLFAIIRVLRDNYTVVEANRELGRVWDMQDGKLPDSPSRA